MFMPLLVLNASLQLVFQTVPIAISDVILVYFLFLANYVLACPALKIVKFEV